MRFFNTIFIMALEIERKYLVKGEYKHLATSFAKITQGYISIQKNNQVRVRIIDNKGFLTIKGGLQSDGVSRFEWEKEITIDESKLLLTICGDQIVEKVRYYVPFNDKIFEVDEFCGKNSGLVFCEIELNDINEHIELPDWVGDEVTGNMNYYNINMF